MKTKGEWNKSQRLFVEQAIPAQTSTQSMVGGATAINGSWKFQRENAILREPVVKLDSNKLIG